MQKAKAREPADGGSRGAAYVRRQLFGPRNRATWSKSNEQITPEEALFFNEATLDAIGAMA